MKRKVIAAQLLIIALAGVFQYGYLGRAMERGRGAGLAAPLLQAARTELLGAIVASQLLAAVLVALCSYLLCRASARSLNAVAAMASRINQGSAPGLRWRAAPR